MQLFSPKARGSVDQYVISRCIYSTLHVGLVSGGGGGPSTGEGGGREGETETRAGLGGQNTQEQATHFI
jgi:hypothetical protein